MKSNSEHNSLRYCGLITKFGETGTLRSISLLHTGDLGFSAADRLGTEVLIKLADEVYPDNEEEDDEDQSSFELECHCNYEIPGEGQ